MVLSSKDNNNDMQLALSMQQGNQQCIHTLYDKYAPALYGIVTRIINNEKKAEKILHQTFININNQISSYNSSISSLFSWLIGIARQTALEEVKLQQTQNSSNYNNVYDAQQNSAFELVYYKGLSYSEVATVLRISTAEVIDSVKITMQGIKEKTVVR